MKVAFFVDNKNIQEPSDFQHLFTGNPGMGGSEYMIFLIAYSLSNRKNGISIRLYTTKPITNRQCIDNDVSKDVYEAALNASDAGFLTFVFDAKSLNWYESPLKHIDITLIPWCHNFISVDEFQIITSHRNLGRVIFVSKEQRDLFRDDSKFDVTDYIFNSVPTNTNYSFLIPRSKRPLIVTYVGCIIPAKSFHILAEIWKDILQKVPNAELYVIGNGQLYDKTCALGKYGIAEESYEQKFIPYLMENGEMLKSVHFMGVLNPEERNKILAKTKIGVPNPLGTSETFCISGLEMQNMGCEVIAMQSPGYYDTFINGIIVKSPKQLTNTIIQELLSPRDIDYSSVLDEINRKFSIDVITSKWEELLKSDYTKHISEITPLTNPFYRYKWLKEIIRLTKMFIPPLKNKRSTIEKFLMQPSSLFYQPL